MQLKYDWKSNKCNIFEGLSAIYEINNFLISIGGTFKKR